MSIGTMKISSYVSSILIILAIVATFCAPSALSAQDIRTIIALLIIRNDNIRKSISKEILLIGQHSKGKYEDVSWWDNSEKKMISQRKALLSKYKSFTVYDRGEIFDSVQIDKTELQDFDCEELSVGIGDSNSGPSKKLIESLSDAPVFYGSKSGRKISYQIKTFIAINSDSPAAITQRNSSPKPFKLSEEQFKQLKSFAKKYLVQKNAEIKEDEVKIETFLSYDFNNDGIIEHILVAKVENDKTKESSVFVVKFSGNDIVPLLNESLSNEPSSWGNGYSFLDVIDIDGDAIPEIIFEVKGYESTGYEIYHFNKDGYFEKTYSTVTYGC